MEIIDLTTDHSPDLGPSRIEQLRQRYCRPTSTPVNDVYKAPDVAEDGGNKTLARKGSHDSSTSAKELDVHDTNITIIDITSDSPADIATNNGSRKRRRSTSTTETEFVVTGKDAEVSPQHTDTATSSKQGRQRRPRDSSTPSPRAPRAAMDKSKPEIFEFTHNFKLRAIQGDESIAIHDEYTVLYTSALSSLTEWAQSLPPSCPLGFDTEGEGRMVQLCCLLTSKILVFVMPEHAMPSYRAQCADVLSTVVGSDSYLKVGVAAFHDAIKLGSIMLVDSARIFELTLLSKDLQFNADTREISRTFAEETRQGIIVITDDATKNFQHGLKPLFSEMFVSQFSEIEPISGPYTEPREVARGSKKWTTYPLRRQELLYAAKDALFGALLYNAFVSHYSDEEIDEKIKSADKSFANTRNRRDKKLRDQVRALEKKPSARHTSLPIRKVKNGSTRPSHRQDKTTKHSHESRKSTRGKSHQSKYQNEMNGQREKTKKKKKYVEDVSGTSRKVNFKNEFHLRQFKAEPGRMLSI